MKLIELNKEEFDNFTLHHAQSNFHQTAAWGEIKQTNGWHNHFVGLVDDDKNILGASLLLSKKIIGNINLFYAPRGFLIDYHNYDLLKEFTHLIKNYAKRKGAIFIKIDPYVIHKERNIDGDIVKDGIDNGDVIDNLKKLGYTHKGFTIYQGTLQPRWMFVLDLKDKTPDQILNEVYNQTTRHCINKTLNSSYIIEEGTLDNIQEFKNVLTETGKRRGFIDRPLSYYQTMYNVLSKYEMIKILLVKFNCDDYIDKLEIETNIKRQQKEMLLTKIKTDGNSKKVINQLKEVNFVLDGNEKKLAETKQLKEEKGNLVTMSAAMFIPYGKEVVYLHSGTYEEFLKYDAPYRIQWEIIKYAIENKYTRYNFYGISGEFNKDKESYGVYKFKKGFNGTVVELIGEFDLVINKFYFFAYNFSYKIYRLLKKIKSEIKE